MYFCQCASWKGKENQAPYRLTSTIIDLALFLDYNARQALKINAQEDHLRIRAGKLKCDRSATYGFWGAHVSISSDILVLIDSCRELWEFLPYSIIRRTFGLRKKDTYGCDALMRALLELCSRFV